MEKLKYLLGFDYYFVVDNEGSIGGLALMEKKRCLLHITNYSKFHIDAQVERQMCKPLMTIN